MEASILDLRYKMKDVLSAIDKNEMVTILYRGKVKGYIVPKTSSIKKRVKEHPLFGLHADIKKSVKKEMEELRRTRYHDI